MVESILMHSYCIIVNIKPIELWYTGTNNFIM